MQLLNSSEWTRFVGARLQRNSGPFGKVGRELGIVGEFSMKIGFNVMPDGTVSDVHLVEGSGDQRLNGAALEIPARAEPFPAFTSDMAPTPRAVVAPLVLNLLSEPKTP
ncbi:TonB family protein [Rhizobium skierniewicense]|uniref:TonB family protein n=1 Tax=Rhizobium skierniewicense TaxID=984260 RepID=UPI003D6DFAE0|nr:TonB family protein [Rhizobium skierniewicense]